MKIENASFLEGARQARRPFEKAGKAASFAETAKAKADEYGRSARPGQAGYEKDELRRKGAVEEFEEKMSGQMDAATRADQMALLANTMTPEDYRRAQEEGFSVQSTDSGTIVTVTDKIKAQLAKAGVDVSHMGGALTKEQMEEIAGSMAAARCLASSFEQADLPATEENMSEGMEALSLAQELSGLSDGAIKYLLDNHLDPSIENLYLAEFSGGAAYVAPNEDIDFEPLKEQAGQVIRAAGRKVSEETLAQGEWMIKSGIALTAENFSYVEKLRGLSFPASEAQLAGAVATAVAEGGRPKDAMLLPEYTIAAQAEHAVEVVTEATDEDIAYLVSNHMELSVENLEQAAALRKQGALDLKDAGKLAEAAQAQEEDEAAPLSDTALAFLKARRILEETRLAMTTEANRALLKRGISIDTRPLEELVEKLKEQENDYYAALLGESGVADAASLAAAFEETAQKVSDLKQMPAYVLGMREHALNTVNELHEAGRALKSAMEAAGESYESLMTAPRRDLGDSIQKAFANVDEILKDLGLETGPANERAVRILAYNKLEISEESIRTMKAADERVQRAFQNLTPATVREMIRQGVNPLDMDLDLLNQKAEAIRAAQGGEETERFSEYLYKLEQNQEISPEERESFIGVYRLIHQVEKTDGAAIGALVSQGAQLTMRNLLTAVRSAKKSGMDYTVDDDFAGVDAKDSGSRSITDQIETAYQANCMKDVMETLTPVAMQKLMQNPGWENFTPEQLKQALAEYSEEMQKEERELSDAYVKEQMRQLSEAAASDEDVYRFLDRFKLPNTVENILAANRMLHKRGQMFSQVFNSDEVFSGEKVDFAAIQDEILERFAHALSTPKEMAAAQEALAETAENVMKTMIQEEEGVTSMDIRELKLMNAQLSIAGKMAEEEEYAVPVLIGGEVTNVSLKIVRGKEKKGVVDVMFETKKAGKVAASIEARENGVSGIIATDRQETKRLLDARMPDLAKGFGEELGDLQASYVSKLNFSRFAEHAAARGEAGETDAQAREVQTKRLYEIAKSFIESVKELEF